MAESRFFTVCSRSPNREAISRLVAPEARMRTIRLSRSVKNGYADTPEPTAVWGKA